MEKEVIRIGPPDYFLLFMVLLLISFGIIMIFSASPSVGYEYFGDPFYFIKKHLLYLFLGILVFIFGLVIDYAEYKKYSLFLVIAVIALLVLTSLPGFGVISGGARRWLNLKIFLFQPSELAKIIVIFFLASAIEKKKEKITDFWQGLLPLLIVVGMIVLFILKQPDLGTTLVIISLTLMMVFVGGARLMHILMIVVTGLLGAVVVILMNPYQMKRIFAYLNPWKDPLGINFHVIQSWIAVGSGGIFGLGLGSSKLKYSYLPQQYTDFIFAILCEEGGFILSLAVVIVLMFFMFRCFRLVLKLQNDFDRYLAMGLSMYLVFQAVLNLCVVLGLVPTTGVPLPFISFGGTSLMISFFACGLLANISRRIN